MSALQLASPSHCFQKPAWAVSSQAFRLPSRAQNSAAAAFTTTAVEMRGCGLRSESGAITSREKSKIFSE